MKQLLLRLVCGLFKIIHLLHNHAILDISIVKLQRVVRILFSAKPPSVRLISSDTILNLLTFSSMFSNLLFEAYNLILQHYFLPSWPLIQALSSKQKKSALTLNFRQVVAKRSRLRRQAK